MRERIGPYRIEKVLAQSEMGLVYKARHETLGRDVAIKTLLPTHAGDAAFRRRFLREAQAQAQLVKNTNIGIVYDFLEDGDELFMAMEYLDGETLAAMLDRQPGRRMTLGDALPLFEQVLVALASVHSEKIVHRDVKPSNVMICRGGNVKLIDFGISLIDESTRITMPGYRVGTVPYMSPEQIEGKSIDHRTDIYSAALVLYRMLAGREPFEAKEYLAQVHERLIGPASLRSLAPDVPSGVGDAVAIALRYDRGARFPSIAAFHEALREGAVGFLITFPQPSDDVETVALADEVESGSSSIEPEPDSHRATAIASIVVAVTFIAAIPIIVQRRGRPPLPTNAPIQKPTFAPAAPSPVVFEVPNRVEAPTTPPKKAAPPKQEPFSDRTTAPVEDETTRLQRELETLRETIQRGLERAGRELEAKRFDAALEELDRAAAEAQRRPTELAQEREQISRLRTRVVDARVAARTMEAETALWEARIAEVEDDLRAGHWPEAERFATDIAKNPRAPEPIAARARALLQQAKDGRKNAFKETQFGTTTNAIRKPSSPPGNEP